MNHEIIQLPDPNEIREFLSSAQQDVDTALKEEPELSSQHQLVTEVIRVMQEQVANKNDLNQLGLKEKISFAAHLNFLQGLLEDLFLGDQYEEYEEEEGEEEELEDENTSK